MCVGGRGGGGVGVGMGAGGGGGLKIIALLPFTFDLVAVKEEPS